MPDTKDKKEYTLTQEPKKEIDKKQEEQGVPVYYENLVLNESQRERLAKEVFKEYDAIVKEQEDKQVRGKWDGFERQYEGKLQEDSRRQFNLTMGVTREHVDQVVNDIMEAVMESDPKFSVSPRPGFEKEGGREVCDKQQDFLDDRLDYLPFRSTEQMVVHSTVLKGTGFLKIFHLIEKEDRRREEEYDGALKPLVRNNQIVTKPNSREPAMHQPGLEDFLRNWPDAEKDYPGLVKKLQAGKKIHVIAQYKDIPYNDPAFKKVELKNFYARLSVDGYKGLKTTKITMERISYHYWELKKLENQKKFYNIDELLYEKGDKEKKKKISNYENRYYNIFEVVYYFKLKENDKETIKVVAWVGEDRRVTVGSILYPHYAIDCYYVPHYIRRSKHGLYGEGLGEILTDSEVADAHLLNSTLEGSYIANLVTPICAEDSEVNIQFLEKRWMHGMPLNAGKGEIDFLQRYMKPPDTNGQLKVLQYLLLRDERKTGVSSLTSGRADPIDPNAPFRKSAMLLQQSNKRIKAYILAISSAINEVGEIILQMYYQISKEGRKFAQRRTEVSNNMPFANISRSEMSARSSIQVQAANFDFDKLNEKREDVIMYQLIRQEILVAKNPEAVYVLLKNIIKGWSPKWRNLVNLILPPLEELKQAQLKMVLQAVMMYIKQVQEKAKLTRQAPEFNLEELMPLVVDLQAQIATPPPPEVVKEQQKKAGA